MILYSSINIKKILKKGKKHKWSRPPGCLKCGHPKIWGHGFVERYFDGYNKPLWMKRYRCPECGTVYTMRPKGNWRRFCTPKRVIIKSIRKKLMRGRWQDGISRQKQEYWFMGFKRQCIRSGHSIQGASLKLLTAFIAFGIIAATHSLDNFTV